MKSWFPTLGRVLVTLLLVAGATVMLTHLWNYYMKAPWTRDGHVHADVIRVAPDVSGWVTELYVQDNQPVSKGQPLFQIDRPRFELALQEAEALVLERTALHEQALRESQRNRTLRNLVATEVVEIGDTQVKRSEAALKTAESQRALAQLNLDRTLVRSPVNGFLSDQTMRVGDYVNTGVPVLSIVDRNSLRVVGYFEETKLDTIRIGSPVEIRLMGESRTLRGRVQSIAAGIEDRDRKRGNSMLPDIDPSFNWVRLAQRIPVRVALEQVPPDMRLISGRTATLSVLPEPAGQTGAEQ